MKKKLFESIKRAIKKAKTCLVASHLDPDGDSIGSMLAMGIILEKLGKEVSFYCQDGVPNIYKFLPEINKIKNALSSNAAFDLTITLDASEVSRLGEKVNFREISKTIVNIDHHPDNTFYGDLNYVETISSVAEEVYQLARYLKVKINKEIADCLYLAMITDTGNFRYEYTSPQTFKIAAELLKAGVRQAELTSKIYDQRRLPSVLLASRALSELEFSLDKSVAWTAVTQGVMQEVGAKGEDLIGLVDEIRSISGVEVAILFREEKDGKIKINFRSKEKVNVSAIAAKFGGGGHVRAAGAVVEGNLNEVKNKVLKTLLLPLR